MMTSNDFYSAPPCIEKSTPWGSEVTLGGYTEWNC